MKIWKEISLLVNGHFEFWDKTYLFICRIIWYRNNYCTCPTYFGTFMSHRQCQTLWRRKESPKVVRIASNAWESSMTLTLFFFFGHSPTSFVSWGIPKLPERFYCDFDVEISRAPGRSFQSPLYYSYVGCYVRFVTSAVPAHYVWTSRPSYYLSRT